MLVFLYFYDGTFSQKNWNESEKTFQRLYTQKEKGGRDSSQKIHKIAHEWYRSISPVKDAGHNGG